MKKIVGKKLRLLRTEKGLSQINIAERVFISESTYRRIESGEGHLDIETLGGLLNLFEVKFSDFFFEVENESNQKMNNRVTV